MNKELEIRGKRAVVAGLGRSGSAAALWLAGRGAEVTVSDLRCESDFAPELLAEMEEAGVRLETGGHKSDTFREADLVVVSPGVPLDIDPVVAALESGVPVLGEMELACRFIDTPMAAVTGTNGKSTVTALLGNMISNSGRRVFVGGNIGTPLIDLAARPGEYDCAVVEVSSYQLDTMESFRPVVSVLLNITPDHLDRYEDFEAYVRSKLRVFSMQEPGGSVVLNDEDEKLRRAEPGEHLTVLRYGLHESSGRAAWLSGNRVLVRMKGAEQASFSLERFAPPGAHNRENALAAVLAALAFGADAEAVQGAIDSFKGLPHRLELVAESHGVTFYNDSKATNVDSAVRAVKSFDGPVILIAGGRHKGGGYGDLVQACLGRVKEAVFLGEAKALLAGSFENAVPFYLADTLEEAVSLAAGRAGAGDAVLFSPACSSFDMFADYEDRGRAFIDAVAGELNGRKGK